MEGLAAVQDRWKTAEGRAKTDRVLHLLASGEELQLRQELGLHEGLVDMRGFCVPAPDRRGKTDFHGIDVDLVERFKATRLVMSSYDFTFADLSDLMWTSCRFERCRFVDSRLLSTLFYDCAIEDCNFVRCDFTGAVLGGHTGRSSGMIINTEFHDGRFQDVVFSFPHIENCLFACDISNVDFDGSMFKDSTFTGKLDKVTFRRWRSDSRVKLGRLAPENKMEHVDFSAAELDDVDFRGGVPLTGCIFPAKPCYFLVLDGSKVFREIKEELESTWEGEDKRIALGFTVNYFLDRVKEGQRHFLIDEDSFSEHWGKPLARRYSYLIAKVAEKHSALGKLQCRDGR